MTTIDILKRMGIAVLGCFIITIIAIAIVGSYLQWLEREIKFNNEQIKKIADSNMEANIWMNTHWARIAYIIEKQEAGRPQIEKKDISVWDLLLCDYHPFDYNFFIEAVGIDKYIGYKNPIEKKIESMTYQEMVDLWCYEVGIQWGDEPPLDNEKE